MKLYETVLNDMAYIHKVSVGDIIGTSTDRDVVNARRHFIAKMSIEHGHTASAIARYINKNHNTIGRHIHDDKNVYNIMVRKKKLINKRISSNG